MSAPQANVPQPKANAPQPKANAPSRKSLYWADIQPLTKEPWSEEQTAEALMLEGQLQLVPIGKQ